MGSTAQPDASGDVAGAAGVDSDAADDVAAAVGEVLAAAVAAVAADESADCLPAEVLLEVFSYLPLADLARAAAVCERWRGLLSRHTAVWRHKEYFSRKRTMAAREEVAAIAAGMPRLRCLHVLRDGEFGVHIAWPEAAVSLCCDAPALAPARPPRRAPAPPYAVQFDTRRLVVCGATFQQCLRWVNCETLEVVRVADQCEGAGTHVASPFYYYRDLRRGSHCYGPVCSFHSPQPAFCALCAYSHHFNCAGAACPLVGLPDGVELWCHPRPDEAGGAAAARAPRPREAVTVVAADGEAAADDEADGLGPSLEAELEAALRRPLPVRFPALREVAVSGAGPSPADLRLLCAAGRPRALRVESPRLLGLSFLRYCRDSLEDLTVADASWLPAEAFRELRQLRALRVLRVAKFRASHTAITQYTRHLPGLRCLLRKPLEVGGIAVVPAQEEEILLE